MKAMLEKLASRSKLQAAILVVLLVLANKYANLGLDDKELATMVSGLVSYIIIQGYQDAKQGPAN